MGKYTNHTDTDQQVLKPLYKAKLVKRISQLVPALNDYVVERLVIITTKHDENDGAPREFELRRLSIKAATGPDACQIADMAKYNYEAGNGHHQERKSA